MSFVSFLTSKMTSKLQRESYTDYVDFAMTVGGRNSDSSMYSFARVRTSSSPQFVFSYMYHRRTAAKQRAQRSHDGTPAAE